MSCTQRGERKAVWTIVTTTLFWWSFFRFHHETRYYHVRKILGFGLCVSRGTAAVLHVCVFLAPVPVSRTIHWLAARAALPRRLPIVCTAMLRRARALHLACVFTLLAASVLHTISHIINAINFSQHFDSEYPEINWAAYQGQHPLILIFTSVVGLTGVGMLIILMMMAVCSLPRVRASHYNLFWFSHHLALPLLLLYVAHPSSEIIKEMTNSKEFSPQCDNLGSNNSTLICSKPIFKAPKSMVWFWVSLPVLLLLLDFFARLMSTWKQLFVSHAAILPGKAVELWLSSPGFFCTPGQYVLLQCPSVSALEWHPYTVIKCPSDCDARFTVIIRARGDWSKAVYTEILQTSKPKTIMSERPIMLRSLRFYVNGPFASPLEEIISLKQVVCIGAGIGITPFVSVLRFMLERDDRKFPERINLIWLTPDPNQILWFAWTISSLHTKCWEQNKPDRFHFSIYVTRNIKQTFVTRQYPLVACRIHTGRPVWTDVFQQLRNENTDGIVHVFGCGSSKLTRTLARHCERTSRQPGGPSFRFVREAYS